MGMRYSVLCVSFSPDGQLIASGGLDCQIKLWQLDGTLRSTLSEHTEAVTKDLCKNKLNN
ncbi:MAG: WD40 repeat domain-containing protein [Microcystaceae cyanobacterium]